MTYALYKEFYAPTAVMKPDIELATADLMVPVIRQGGRRLHPPGAREKGAGGRQYRGN